MNSTRSEQQEQHKKKNRRNGSNSTSMEEQVQYQGGTAGTIPVRNIRNSTRTEE
jgi:hypothetical protein